MTIIGCLLSWLICQECPLSVLSHANSLLAFSKTQLKHCLLCVCLVAFNSLPPHGVYPPGSFVRGIFQARIWSGLPFPTPGDLPNPETEAVSLESPAVGQQIHYCTAWELQHPKYFSLRACPCCFFSGENLFPRY